MPTIFSTQKPAPRIRSGLYSLDWAARQSERITPSGEYRPPVFGVPTRGIWEVYGDSTTGKSSFGYFLASIVAMGPNREYNTNVKLVDIEGGLDLEYLEFSFGASGFDGEVHVADREDSDGDPRLHEDMVMEASDCLLDPAFGAAMFDSVSMFMSASERGGNIGDANMGRRAKALGQMNRRASGALEAAEQPKVLIHINHKYDNLGSPGHTSAGGKSQQNAPIARVWVKRLYQGDFGKDADHFRSELRFMKFRKGGKGRIARVAFIAGYGIHPGITAMFDCIDLGLLSNAGGWLKTKDKKPKKLGRTTDHISAAEGGVLGTDDRFKPFYSLLDVYENNVLIPELEEAAKDG